MSLAARGRIPHLSTLPRVLHTISGVRRGHQHSHPPCFTPQHSQCCQERSCLIKGTRAKKSDLGCGYVGLLLFPQSICIESHFYPTHPHKWEPKWYFSRVWISKQNYSLILTTLSCRASSVFLTELFFPPSRTLSGLLVQGASLG